MSVVSGSGVPVAIDGLTIGAGGRVLLDGAAARFEPGKVTLLIGPSGAGKSLLLRAIAGLLGDLGPGIDVAGSIRVGDREALGRGPGREVGVVFQSFALFDELSAAGNVAFAAAHRRRGGGSDPTGLLDELGVPKDVPVARLSGGQQQRLAIARTLAADPDVVLYDEPTSGLDPASAERVAQRIRSTQDAHPKTAIVVTHDYQSLAWIADRVYVLDVEARALREIDPADWPRLHEQVAPPSPAGVAHAAPAQRASNLLHRVGDLLEALSRGVEAAVAAPFRILPLWRSPRWGLRYLGHYLRLVTGPSALGYLAVAGLILGFVATWFTFRYMPYAEYTEPLVAEEVLGAVGYALYRILIPLVGTILIAARCGAAVAADVGSKVYGRQLDALRALGASPATYLGTNVLWSFLLGSPLLIGVSFVAARFASLVAFTVRDPVDGPWFWDQHFDTQLLDPSSGLYLGSGWLLAKVLVCAFGTARIAWHRAAQRKDSAASVGVGVTSTILWSTLWVLAVHLTFAFFEFEQVGGS